MKKALLIAGVISTALMLTACDSDQPQESNSVKETEDLGFGNEVLFYTDPSNGCEYLIYSGHKAGNIIPRMNPDGTQVCN